MIQMTTLLLMNVVLFILLSTARAFPQQITWLYAKDLDKGANFLGSTVELIEVEGLIQVDKCRIFPSTSSSSFIGVCNTRDPPNCGNNAEDVPTPVTYTLVVDSEEAVDETYNKLLGVNGTEVFVLTTPNESAIFGSYSFNFYDTDVESGLGCYRFEVQYFIDNAWPSSSL